MSTRRLGVEVTVVPCCAISNKGHYVKVAQALAQELGGFFVNQFENLSNCSVHFDCTGPELLLQCKELTGVPPDAFVMSAGTGGTVAGVSRCVCVCVCGLHLSPSDRTLPLSPVCVVCVLQVFGGGLSPHSSGSG